MTSQAQARPLAGIAFLAIVVGAIGYAHAVQAEPFNGPYLGVEGGYETSDGPDGLAYGAYGGWNFRASDRFVIGFEGRVGGTTGSQRTRLPAPGGGTVDITDRIGRQFGLAARAGVLAGERTMLYGKAGWENLQLIQRQRLTPPTGAPRDTRLSATDDSLVLGLGVEHALSETISLRGTWDWVESSDRHQLKAGIAFHF
ncbi:MAG: outer membrane protein [Sphingomonadaceae bacterium]